jgi:hypothetical protein
MEESIISGPSNDDPHRHAYLRKREEYSHEDNSWETYDNVLECSMHLLNDYYGKDLAAERDGCYGKKTC